MFNTHIIPNDNLLMSEVEAEIKSTYPHAFAISRIDEEFVSFIMFDGELTQEQLGDILSTETEDELEFARR